MAWDLGDTVPLTAEITDAGGDPTPASGVVCTIGLPDGTTDTPSTTNPSTGVYQVDYVPTLPGRHTVRWVSEAPATAFSDMFDVRPANPRYLVSLADAKSKLRYDAGANSADEDLRTFLEACTDVIEEYLDEVVAQRTLTVVVSVSNGRAVIPVGPVISLTTVTSEDGATTWDVANLRVRDGVLRAVAGPALRGDLEVTLLAGRRELPPSYSLAVWMILRHLWETQRAGYGGTAARGYGQGQGDADVVTVAGWDVPRGALTLLGVPGPLVA
jgi:hypothetical protein